MTFLKKVQSGRPLKIPAATFNTIIDTAQDFLNRKQSGGAGATKPNASPSGIILVRNDSGSDVNRFGILGIDDIVISPTDNSYEFHNHPILSCVEANPGLHAGKWVVLQKPIPAGGIGRAVIVGVTISAITISNPDHKYVDLRVGSTGLRSGYTGAGQILWSQIESGGWAVIRLAHPMQTEPLDTTGLSAGMVYSLRSYGGVLKPAWDYMTINDQL